jgi:hypothetical protein
MRAGSVSKSLTHSGYLPVGVTSGEPSPDAASERAAPESRVATAVAVATNMALTLPALYAFIGGRGRAGEDARRTHFPMRYSSTLSAGKASPRAPLESLAMPGLMRPICVTIKRP